LKTVVIKAFPNPADDYFYLSLNDDISNNKLVSVYNMNGGLLHQEIITGDTQIDTSKWAAGVYVVKVGDSFLRMVII
jgi:hypothetical protein